MNTEIKNKEFSGAAPFHTADTYVACTFKRMRFLSDDLSGRNFCGCSFEDCFFVGAKVVGSKFMSCEFKGDISSVLFKECTIYSCTFDGQTLFCVKFDECDMSGSRFHNCMIKNGLFNKCDCTEGEFDRATFVRTHIFDCCWDGADIQRAIFYHVDTSKANFALLGYDERGYLFIMKRMKDGALSISAGCRQDFTMDAASTHWAGNLDIKELLAHGESVASRRGWC
jgi:uncharacterized protein YjbI with pentapeptide repeats